MRVLFFHGDPAWSGRARAFVAAGRVLQERGCTVSFACRPQSVVEQRAAEEGLGIVSISEQGTWADESRRVRRALLEHFVEVVFVHGERDHLIAATALRLAGRGAVIRRIAAGAPLTNGRTERTAARLAASGFLFGDPRGLQGATAPPRPLEPVAAPPGVSVERHGEVRAATRASLGVPSDGRLLVCVVDAASRPRVATVLRTASLLARRHPGLRLALLGGGADDEHLRTHAAALGITPLVQFLGEREDHLAVLSAADVGWVTAEQDAAAWAFLDIMAMRVPTLAERAPLAEVYVHDGIGGLLLPRGDANAAAAAIAALLCDEDRRQAMGRAAHGRVAREFTETRMAEGFERAAAAARDRAPWVR